MSGNVGGQDGNQINIKLYNGKTVNLKKLDKLIGKSTEGSVFARFDTADNGGNANNVFDEAEINRIKNTLLQYQASGNSVSQDELNMMFGYGQIGPDLKQRHFDVNKLTSLIDSLPDDDAQPEQSVKGTHTLPKQNRCSRIILFNRAILRKNLHKNLACKVMMRKPLLNICKSKRIKKAGLQSDKK